MRFLDANVFIYAYYKPKRKLNQKEQLMKDQAKEIINKINQGKEEVTTTVHACMLFAHTKDAEKKYKTQKKEGSLRGISPEYVF